MQYLGLLADFLLHVDQHLAALLSQYGGWIYAILFLIVFCETGLVVMPFLPGDSLLFIAGALAAGGGMNPWLVAAVLFAAAVLGDTVNYAIGRHFGKHIERWPNSRFFKRSALDYTHGFYERHGGKTIIIARFMPLVRTFAPFVAGMAPMAYRRFAAFNVLGAALWVGPLVMLGYWFGNFPFIKNNLTAVILGIVALSLTPLMLAWLRHRRASARKAVSHP
ncbi:DedA family protein [Pusillimonas sp. CC-YST705]|uniref:DedA family protein n=1 Tax=Mesopusillimonas faecipullorum TaxID=2755040 RepID=A0ABS8CCX7_9BURK|nr:DedA family protein [Mesopusillimonas faecipullorum]MCB5363873.1 DedA family protein [Mesopusillimonas faecipullorum]